MGYPAATGQGISDRRDARPRPCTDGPPPPQFLRNFEAPERRRFAQQGWVVCFLLRAVHGAAGERGEGGSRRLRNTGRCALTALRKSGSPAPAAFSLAPQLLFQSNAIRRCANLRTGKRQLSASGGPKFSN